jgi:hypothetical protein
MSTNRDTAIQALEQRNTNNEQSLRQQLTDSYATQANLKAEISQMQLKLKVIQLYCITLTTVVIM